jgi:hypothetical protein
MAMIQNFSLFDAPAGRILGEAIYRRGFEILYVAHSLPFLHPLSGKKQQKI